MAERYPQSQLDLSEFLEEAGVSKYMKKLIKKGIRNANDLIDVTPKILKNDIKMKSIEANRLLRKIDENLRIEHPKIHAVTPEDICGKDHEQESKMACRKTYNKVDCKELLIFIEINPGECGGYKQELLEKDLNEMQINFFVCNKCNGVMQNACLINGSDQIFACKLCLSKGESSIPMEKSTSSITQLSAKCPLVNRGCMWNGILGEIDSHLDECTEFMMNCSDMCGVILKRSELKNHRENECQLRNVRCQYCGATVQYKMLEYHYETCLEFPLLCSKLCMKSVIRKEMESHIETECPNAPVACPYKEMGCEVLSKRSESQKHEKTYESKHFDIAKVFYSKKIESMKLKIQHQRDDIQQLTNKMRNIESNYQQLRNMESPGARNITSNSRGVKLTEQFKDTKIYGANKTSSKVTCEGFVENLLKDCRLEGYKKAFDIQDALTGVDKDVLTQDSGMSNLEANKFMRLISERKRAPNSVAPSSQDLNNLSNEASKMQTRKAALDIQYQLFTNLTPEKKRVGPFNTDQILYCDLVNIIRNQERNELGEDMTVELYTCEGYPLATRPISYISKLSDWCLEEYPDTPLLYAVPRLKCYTDKCTQYMTEAPLCDGIDHIFIRNVECDFKRTIQTNCNKAKYFQLIKTIEDMTGIPGHLIHLYQADKQVHSNEDSLTVDKLNIGNQSALEMKLNDHFWTLGKDKNFSLQECKPTWHQEQTTFGISLFFSCLYSLADWMAEPDQKTSGILHKTLGHIRSITGCPPLIHALNLIFSEETLTLPHRVAIQECLVLLFKMINSKTPKLHLPNFEVINSEKVTGYSNYFWVYLIDYSAPSHMQSEHYFTFKLTCSETYHRMTDPVIVKDVNGVEHIVEQIKVSTEIIVKYLYNYKRMIKCFIGDEAVVWNGISVPTCGIDLTGEWKSLVKKCKNYPALCVQAPLNVESTECRRSCMIPTENGNIGVYTGNSKYANQPHVYYEVTTGQSILFDAHELDRDVKLKQPPCFKRLECLTNPGGQGLEAITRDPEEIIMVILDSSESMESAYLDGMTKHQSVVEAFSAFCNLSTAYDLKHVIGLTLFAKNCNLQYPLSENFRKFKLHFEITSQGKKSIYEAIKFGIEELNKFTTLFPEYKAVSRRILCLADGGDNHSNITPKKVTQLLIENKIIMDCVLLCGGIVDTHAIAKASGGYSFKPKDSQELLSIFEQETMLSMKTRQHCTAAFIPGEEIDLLSQVILPIDSEPTHLLPGKINIKVQTPQKCLERALIQKQLSSHTDLTIRILQELSYYQAHPHPAIEVFPGEEHIDFWRIIMEGPGCTPYEGGIFELFIEFTNEYPTKPPNIRFITPIYHCNINSSGRIYHTILDRFYAPRVRVGDIFNYVYGLLIFADLDDPLDSMKANILRFNSNQYLQNAKYHTEQYAKMKSLRDVRITLLGSDKNMNYPAEFVCPLTLKLFQDPVLTAEGDTYERETILNHLRSGKNYDPFTFKKLHEDELRPNEIVQKLVTYFKQDIKRAGLL